MEASRHAPPSRRAVGRTIGGHLALISGNQGVWDSEALRGNQGSIKCNQGAIKGQSRELKRQSRDSRLSVALDHCGTHYQWHTTKGTQ